MIEPDPSPCCATVVTAYRKLGASNGGFRRRPSSRVVDHLNCGLFLVTWYAAHPLSVQYHMTSPSLLNTGDAHVGLVTLESVSCFQISFPSCALTQTKYCRQSNCKSDRFLCSPTASQLASSTRPLAATLNSGLLSHFSWLSSLSSLYLRRM